MLELDFTFTEKCWEWQGKGAWHFITVPKDHSEEIKFFTENHFGKRRGWGAVRVTARIGIVSGKLLYSLRPALTLTYCPLKWMLEKNKK